MPELPEVEVARQSAERYLKNKRIKQIEVVHDTRLFKDGSAKKWAETLRGRTVKKACRKGKHLWFEMDRRPWPGFHFGMTGGFHFYRQEEDRPKFWKFEWLMSDGTRFAMISKRRLGAVRLKEDPAREAPISKLGFDPLFELPSPREFMEWLDGRKATIKAVLLDQQFSAGVGNWVADEILYQSKIDPRRKATDLSEEEIRELRKKMRYVVKRAVEVDADADRYPKTWLFHVRWERKKQVTTHRGEKVRHATVAGRTTAWAPDVQK